MRKFTKDELFYMSKVPRLNLVNCLTGYKSANLIGTCSESGVSNLAIFSSVTHLGSEPALLGFILRPTTVPRDTYKNIKETGYFTLNHITEDMIDDAHHTSSSYEEGISEFEKTGLTPEYKDHFFAPYVAESKIQLGIEFKEKVPISVNNTTLIIGEIIQIYIPEDCLNEDGFVDIEKANSITCSGFDSYHKTVQLDRLSYAKPNQDLTSLLNKH